MGKRSNIAAAKADLPPLRTGEANVQKNIRIIELFSALQRDDCAGKRLHSALVAREELYGGSALCRVAGLQVNGAVCAGFPSPAEEELRDVISFDDYLAPHPETSFLLSVTGDSMTGAGIMEKDLVIVERGRQPRDGDIILAEVDGNWTMKYFRKKGRTVTLEAANPGYPLIVPQTELRIAGVITALVRKYHR
jgi:SOS-response transcriptional repressor LexA